MIAVADTHAALWYLYDDPRLGLLARRIFDEAIAREEKFGISSISFAEVVYLVEKRRLHATAFEELREAVEDSRQIFREIPLTTEVVNAMRLVSRDEIPDMPDRIVAATGVFLGIPVLSRDGKISASSVETIW